MPKSKKIKVLLDTNLIFSAALIPQSLPDKLFRSWLKGFFELLTTKEQLEEIKTASKKDTLASYPFFTIRIAEFIQNLEFAAKLAVPIPEIDLPLHSRDPKDDYLLAVSLGGKADYLITGDKDLLVLNGNLALGNLKIITAKEFLDII